MVAIGDWIEMPSHGADGDVIEVALTTVKVRNFDKTITTIPPYDLISRSFKNWRGMKEAGGRRIARSIHIDVNSIRICSEAQLERFARIRLIRDYVAAKREEVAAHNRLHGLDGSEPVNGRKLTNMGTFRAYVVAYLRSTPPDQPGDDAARTPARPGGAWAAAPDLRLHRHHGVGRVRSDPVRYLRPSALGDPRVRAAGVPAADGIGLPGGARGPLRGAPGPGASACAVEVYGPIGPP
jgi:hypothetical protein